MGWVCKWKLFPACSAILVHRVRDVEPMYSDAEVAQRYLYITEELKQPGRVSLNRKNEPIVNLFIKTMLKSM